MPKVDARIEGLVERLGGLSPRWSEAFPLVPSGYRKLQRLIQKFGYVNVKEALQFALEIEARPDNPLGYLLGTLSRNVKVEDVPVQEGML